MIKKKGDVQTLRKVMGRIYKPHVIQQKIDELGGDEVEEQTTVSYGQVLFDPQYRRASWVGIFLAMFQIFTGINIFMSYSNIIFEGSGMPTTTITAIIGVVNFFTVFGGAYFLFNFGRRSIMLWGTLLIGISNILIGLFY